MTRKTLKWTLLTLLWTLPLWAQRQGPFFYPDDPLWTDNDRLDVPLQPTEIELSPIYDLISHVFGDVGSETWGEAENVNTLDEVPNSSWFVNRHGHRRMSIEELRRGPDKTDSGPVGTWTVFRSKQQGLTPGFHILDEKGVRYVIKFAGGVDPELNSAAEVIATKIFYALGYHVPKNYIVHLDPKNLRLRPGTVVRDRFGDEKALTEKGLRRQMRKVPRRPDGTIRVLASQYIDGTPLGPFRYFDTRSDDPNDVIPHEQRRELRGLRLFAAWTNHDDTRAHNTQSSWVEEGGKHYVRHYLIDFGSTFGSGSVDIQAPNLSYHYFIDAELMKKNVVGFGFHVPKYHKVKWPLLSRYPAVGRYESDFYVPEEWKNNYPNPAFVRMSERDAFWAAKLIMRFTPEELAAIVEQGRFSDPVQREYFLKVLVARQRKTGHYGLHLVNPLDEFEVSRSQLRFSNLSEKYGFSNGATYEARWGVHDNADGRWHDRGSVVTASKPLLELPSVDFSGVQDPYLAVKIRTLSSQYPIFAREVTVYLRPSGSNYLVVGIERESTPNQAPES